MAKYVNLSRAGSGYTGANSDPYSLADVSSFAGGVLDIMDSISEDYYISRRNGY